jgi:hypothetical protein
MRKLAIVAVAASALVFGALAVAAASPDDLLKDEKHFYEQSQKTYSGGSKAGSALNMEVVGHNNLGIRGFNADVWKHKNYAYVGHWGFGDWATGNDRFCPSFPDNGVAVLDVSDPTRPTRVATLQNPAGTSAEDVVVYTAKYGPLSGHDIAAAGIQWCGGGRHDPAAVHGLMLWDVTNAAKPKELGFYNSGCCTRGVHEFEVGDRPDLGKTLVYASVPYAERPDPDSPNGMRDRAGKGEARIIDITNPRAPVELSTFGIKKALGLDPTAGVGCFAISFGHGMTPSEDGKLLFVSYWDAGFITLDTTNPAAPRYLGKTSYAANEDGDGHSASYDDARRILFTADEDFCKGGPGIVAGWGYMRVWDASKPGALKQIGEFHTQNSYGKADPGAGDYVVHNPLVVGTDVYLSWYTDGVRVVDARNPRNPVEVANFVPPAYKNPVHPDQRNTLTNTTQVWGIDYDEATGLAYASDMNSGLWILKRT